MHKCTTAKCTIAELPNAQLPNANWELEIESLCVDRYEKMVGQDPWMVALLLGPIAAVMRHDRSDASADDSEYVKSSQVKRCFPSNAKSPKMPNAKCQMPMPKTKSQIVVQIRIYRDL